MKGVVVQSQVFENQFFPDFQTNVDQNESLDDVQDKFKRSGFCVEVFEVKSYHESYL